MTERDIPEGWSLARARKPDINKNSSPTPQAGKSQNSGVPATGYNSKSVKQRKKQNPAGLSINNDSEANFEPSHSTVMRSRWLKSWIVWAVLLTLIPGSIGFMATAMLLKLPTAPNCPAIFWPLASASVRLHCAQLAASKQSVKDLLQAIALVRSLPGNHPLRGEIDRFLEEWSRDILRLADQSFQSGNLKEAIATAHQIPEDLTSQQLVDQQIAKWQSIWTRAEGMYQEAEKELRQRHWQSAFMLAAKLLRVDNKYWATTKYDQLNRIIITARDDGDQLYKAENLAKSNRVNDVLKAIQLAESIKPDSYLYQKAQELILGFGRRMLKLAQRKMDQRDADTALGIARKIPKLEKLQIEVDDFIALGEAQKSAFTGDISGLEAAISQAQQIDISRGVYDQAQQLIASWQLEIEDVARLEKARTLASQGTINDLAAAISEVQLIPTTNPRAQEAQKELERWNYQVQTIEDQPFLDRAEQIAILDDTNSLRTAIAEASQISSDRALYSQARSKIREWTGKIQRIEDQPYLDQAQALADSGNLPGAIATIQRIASSKRALANQAKTAINGWQQQISDQQNWKKAQALAAASTPQSLVEAIRLANRVSKNNVLRMDANFAIDQWSQQLLQIASSESEGDIAKAIDTAQLIPRSSNIYRQAQEQIRTWRQLLNPEPSPEVLPDLSPPPEESLPSPSL
ncbi:chromosome segregation ATPase [Cronbergia sp. UHCC 0137]|uniref:chromosome segregation ATPase n=1 Tax=Cronbergia sp. UHCC 0137 TaxID=3110239 RepID=UPI002B1F0C04|nr:chromosome segregation ATPase [Cronbergia sp. UHCC 0137]MEA5619498.1 chromosome segregation ATPase [Cronbergia sp. UHCC 0137]